MKKIQDENRTIEILPDVKDVIQRAAEIFIETANKAIESKGQFSVALSGGSTPRALYELLAQEPYVSQIEWQRAHVFWSDERCVSPEDEQSNYRMANKALLKRVPIPQEQIHRMRSEEKPRAAAEDYEKELAAHFKTDEPRFDLILLGMGDDGHTASLFPDTSAVYETEKYVVAPFVEKLNTNRLTFTFKTINAAAKAVFLVTGESKAEALNSVLNQPQRIFPASLVNPTNGEVIFLIDEAASIEFVKPKEKIKFREGLVRLPVSQSFPVLTILVCVLCVVGFVALSMETNQLSWETRSKYGHFSAEAIWNGKYWGVITAAFVHGSILHLMFNMYWMWILGGAIEKAIGKIKWLLLFVGAAFVGSSLQLAVSGDTGIGASGVVYAFFGFVWIARERYGGFEEIASKQNIILFIGWFFFCIFATYAKVMNIANAAHLGGLLFGVGVAGAFVLKYKKPLSQIGLLLLIIVSIVPLFWAPWLDMWVGKKALDAHKKHNYKQALILYQKHIDMGGDRVWALSNMAYVYYAEGNDAKFNETLNALRLLDKAAAQEVEDKIKEGNKKLNP